MSKRTSFTASPSAGPDLYTPGGPLTVTDPLYVSRAADGQLLEAVQSGQFCYILTPRQMGKSSLMYRTAAAVKQLGICSVVIDLTAIGGGASTDEWYLGHLTEIVSQLGLTTDYVAWWESNKQLSAVQRFGKFCTQIVLTSIPQPLVIFIDEIDTTLKLSFSDDYFAALRSLFSGRAADPALKRLTFVLLGVASPSDLIKDASRTPFNIGRRIHLTDFEPKEALPLSFGLSSEQMLAEKLLDRVLFWTGGHPYLTQTACRCIAEWAQSSKWDPSYVPEIADQLIDQQFLSERGRNTDTNLQFVSDRILEDDAAVPMLRLYRRIRRGDMVTDDELNPVHMTLKLSGLIKANDGKILKVRNHIYERVFDEAWVRSELARRKEPIEDDEQKTGFQTLIPKFLRRKHSEFKYDAFVAYSRRDAEWVEGYLIPNLTRAGLTVFNEVDVPSGAFWNRAIEKGIRESRSFLFVASPASTVSEWCADELDFAFRLREEDPEHLIVPILLREATLPLRLRRIQVADFTDREKWDRAMEGVLQALEAPMRVRPLQNFELRQRTEVRDTATIRQLLDSAFEEEDLLGFTYDYFRPVYAETEPNISKRMRIQQLIEYAERENKVDDLLDRIAETRPAEYRRFSERFERPSAAT